MFQEMWVIDALVMESRAFLDLHSWIGEDLGVYHTGLGEEDLRRPPLSSLVLVWSLQWC